MSEAWPRIAEELAKLPELLAWHVLITMVAVALAAAVSLPVGVAAARRRWLRGPALGAASLIQTVPGIALLALVFAALVLLRAVLPERFGFQALGLWPTLIALTLYALLPMLRNTVTGLEGVDPAAVEAARGLGMTPTQRLVRVELPLAMPVLVAGLRTALVWTVGMATLSTPIGQPSLGNYIFGGLQTNNLTAILTGCVAAAALALVLDGLVGWMQHAAQLRQRKPLWIGALCLVVIGAGAAATLAAQRVSSGVDRPVVRVGAKNWGEQFVLARVIAGRLNDAGYETRLYESLGSLNAFQALAADEIDVYVDYSGTLWANVLQREPGPGREDMLEQTAAWLQREKGVTLFGPLGFENAYALAMREDDAERLGVVSIDDLTPHAPGLRIGSDIEFFQRPEWGRLRDAYGLSFAARVPMNPTLMYQAVRSGDVDVITAFTSDGRIPAFGLRLLTDDRAAFPPYDAVVLLSNRAASDPELVSALRPLLGALGLELMQEANRRVDIDGETPAAVAAWLRGRLSSRAE